jgi:hypothetical protein
MILWVRTADFSYPTGTLTRIFLQSLHFPSRTRLSRRIIAREVNMNLSRAIWVWLISGCLNEWLVPFGEAEVNTALRKKTSWISIILVISNANHGLWFQLYIWQILKEFLLKSSFQAISHGRTWFWVFELWNHLAFEINGPPYDMQY